MRKVLIPTNRRLNPGLLTFKDLNKNNRLDAYEDWRLPVEQRIGNLLGQMTLEEKVGMLLINTLNAGEYGHITDRAVQFIEDEKMTRFVFRNVLKIRCWPLISDNPMFWIKIPES